MVDAKNQWCFFVFIRMCLFFCFIALRLNFLEKTSTHHLDCLDASAISAHGLLSVTLDLSSLVHLFIFEPRHTDRPAALDSTGCVASIWWQKNNNFQTMWELTRPYFLDPQRNYYAQLLRLYLSHFQRDFWQPTTQRVLGPDSFS
jgi:hypothetical protein